ncbi:MAG: dihydroorotase [Sphingobacteriales bacterium]|nr:dihydroorotase [Sphingobacteriales bacterium]
MQKYLFKNISVVNEGEIVKTDVLVVGERIERIGQQLQVNGNVKEIDGEEKFLLPGIIDDQVHFREPGLSHKGNIFSESRAAVAGGVTSFMEMPNTIPPALNLQLLEDKYAIASKNAFANYSFYMGVSNDNASDALRVNDHINDICGIKIFMGSSTGNMLVDNINTIEKIFSESEILIATHCEDENIARKNLEHFQVTKSMLTPADHPLIRDEEVCYASSLRAVKMAQKFNTRLHILHISTEKELQLFGNMMPLKDKRITAEVCVHHLHFTSDDYETLGYKIKCNPAIKAAHNKNALWKALLDDRLDVIATDHAPHLLSEKEGPYTSAHAGLPLVQHPLLLMLHYYQQGIISLEKIVEKMSHAVATCYQIAERGYVREGYFADLVVVDLNKPYQIDKSNILYHCGWSPLEGFLSTASITHTMVNGNIVYENNQVNESFRGKRLSFNRK